MYLCVCYAIKECEFKQACIKAESFDEACDTTYVGEGCGLCLERANEIYNESKECGQ